MIEVKLKFGDIVCKRWRNKAVCPVRRLQCCNDDDDDCNGTASRLTLDKWSPTGIADIYIKDERVHKRSNMMCYTTSYLNSGTSFLTRFVMEPNLIFSQLRTASGMHHCMRYSSVPLLLNNPNTDYYCLGVQPHIGAFSAGPKGGGRLCH